MKTSIDLPSRPLNNPRAILVSRLGTALRHCLENPPKFFRLAAATAALCFCVSGLASTAIAQDSLFLFDAQRPNGIELSPRDLFREERAPNSYPARYYFLSTQGEVVQPPPEVQSSEPEEPESIAEELSANPPGSMLLEGVGHWFRNTPFFGHGVTDVRDPRRHWGVGVPLEGTSWRNRPWHVGIFIGFLDGGEVANGTVLQDSGLFLGIRVGNDFDHYWGWELRGGISQVDLTNATTGVPLPQSGRNAYYDLNVLYYPLGDTRWRPYISLGLGVATHGFSDLRGNSYDESTATMPIGLGVKYFIRPGISLRTDFTNNISLGTTNAGGMDNISLTLGLDWHFGGQRKVYYPWDSSIQVW